MIAEKLGSRARLIRIETELPQMSGLGLGFSAELADTVLNDPVNIRDALVLSDMFKPGCKI